MVREILRKLLASGGNNSGGPAARETYEGLEILAWPQAEGQVWRIAGRIQRVADDEGAVYDYVRADTVGQHEEAVRMSLVKGRQLIDEQGEGLFNKRT